MAIAGLLVRVLSGQAEEVEAAIGAMPEMTTYGVHHDNHLVVVADAPHEKMEILFRQVRDVPGVLTCAVTSMTLEDELFPE
ncbi:MAG: chaperone NapD [Desulfovibrio sp.]|jgi:nitrate reductase NapAB chaperone NapD|nr:chaperone NapD [Desulfovibrio sp.]